MKSGINQVIVDNTTITMTFPASTVFTRGDLLALNTASNPLMPQEATSLTDQGSAAANQALFTPLFLGVAFDNRLSTDPTQTGTSGNSDNVIVTDGIFDCPCSSAAFNVGDLVGIDRDGTNNVFLNQQVVKVTNPALAIGIVVRSTNGANTTVVRCRLISRIANSHIWSQITNAIPTPLSASGAVPPSTGARYVITKGAIAALTLAAPTAGVDDGKVIEIFSSTAYAHTLTATGILNTGSIYVNEATFAAHAGASLKLVAYQAQWYVLSQIGITFS